MRTALLILEEGKIIVSNEHLFILMNSPCEIQKLFQHPDCSVVGSIVLLIDLKLINFYVFL